MCSEPLPRFGTVRRPRRAFSTRYCAMLLAAALLAACGKKAPPLPPPNMTPAAVKSVKLEQRGGELVVELAYPTTAVSGLALPGLAAVEVWELVRPLPAAPTVSGTPATTGEPATAAEPTPGASGEPVAAAPPDGTATPAEPPGGGAPAPVTGQEPAPPGAAGESVAAALPSPPTEPPPPTVDPREFAAASQLRLKLEGSELAAAIVGDRIQVRLPLPDPLPQPVELHAIGVRTVSTQGKSSAMSPPAVLVPAAPPGPPTGLVVTPRANGVELAWTSEVAGLKGFNVYRRDAQSRIYLDPLATPAPEVRSYVDTGAPYGGRYIYSVTAIERLLPLLESGLGGEREIAYEDRFAPPPPRRLVALPEQGQVRLLWEASDAPDVAGYLVFRALEAGEPELLNATPVPDPQYVDTTAESGRAYRYAVRAIDEAGNRSGPSNEAEVKGQ